MIDPIYKRLNIYFVALEVRSPEMNTVMGRIATTINEVDEAMALHRMGGRAPLSLKLLENVRLDLIRMAEKVQHRDYTPGYPRFVLDWPGDEEFVRDLVNLAYDYNRKAV